MLALARGPKTVGLLGDLGYQRGSKVRILSGSAVLNAASDVQEATSTAFAHSQVPFRSRPVFLRLVSTMSRAKDYAAGGFHVSVDRMNGGGCKDDWQIHAGGTKAVACKIPLGRADVRGLWSNATGKYLTAFQATATSPVGVVKQLLAEANAAADLAFRAEGIEPPRDPVTGASEAPVAKRNPLLGLALASTGLATMLYFAFKHEDTGGGSSGSFMGTRSRRKRRSRR